MGRVSGFGELADGLAARAASRRPIRRSLLPLLKDIGSDIPLGVISAEKQQNLLIFVCAFD